MRLTGALRQSTMRMPSWVLRYERAPMSTSRRLTVGLAVPRAGPGTSSSSLRCPKYGHSRSTEPLTPRPRCARSAPRLCICSKSAGRSSGLATATSSRSSSIRSSSSNRPRAAETSAPAAESSARCTVDRRRSSSPTIRDASASSSRPGTSPAEALENEVVTKCADRQIQKLEPGALALDLGLKTGLHVVEERRKLAASLELLHVGGEGLRRVMAAQTGEPRLVVGKADFHQERLEIGRRV